jgi:hypothetical protein
MNIVSMMVPAELVFAAYRALYQADLEVARFIYDQDTGEMVAEVRKPSLEPGLQDEWVAVGSSNNAYEADMGGSEE